LIGLGAAGTAIATQGRQGGVEEVQHIESQQAQDQRANEAQQMAKKALVSEMNLRQMETANLLQNMTQERKKYGLDMLNAQVDLAQKLGVPVKLIRNLGDPDYQSQVYQAMGHRMSDIVSTATAAEVHQRET
jgi:hypothetical protein